MFAICQGFSVSVIADYRPANRVNLRLNRKKQETENLCSYTRLYRNQCVFFYLGVNYILSPSAFLHFSLCLPHRIHEVKISQYLIMQMDINIKFVIKTEVCIFAFSSVSHFILAETIQFYTLFCSMENLNYRPKVQFKNLSRVE